MTSVIPTSGVVSSPATQASPTKSGSEGSLFLSMLKGLSADIQSLAAGSDSTVRIKSATVSTNSGLSGPLFSGQSLTVSGDLTETQVVNGHRVTTEDAFSYTQFAPGQAYGVEAAFGISPITDSGSGTQGSNGPVSPGDNGPTIHVGGVAQNDFSVVSASVQGGDPEA